MEPITIAEARDLVQIAFFVIVATVTVFTYVHARRTLLQPLRTEVFKQQLKLMSDLLDFLIADYVGEINSTFPVDQLMRVNTAQMFDDYAESQLGFKIDRDARPYSPKTCPARVIPVHLLTEAGPYIDGGAHQSSGPKWTDYKYEAIALPESYVAAQEKLRAFARSPLAPKKLIQLLRDLDRELHVRTGQVGEVLTECAREMPATYPDAATMKMAAASWVMNRFNQRTERLEPTVDKIVEYARGYFKPERLLT